MKIDLYNNHEVFVKETTQTRSIRKWCRDVGLDYKTIEHHPCVEDIRLLMDLRIYHSVMNDTDRQVFDRAWNYVYANGYALSRYWKNKLLQIVAGIEFRQQRIQYIKARQQRTGRSINEFEKEGHNDE